MSTPNTESLTVIASESATDDSSNRVNCARSARNARIQRLQAMSDAPDDGVDAVHVAQVVELIRDPTQIRVHLSSGPLLGNGVRQGFEAVSLHVSPETNAAWRSLSARSGWPALRALADFVVSAEPSQYVDWTSVRFA